MADFNMSGPSSYISFLTLNAFSRLNETLKEASPVASSGRGGQQLRAVLMVSELALALILLIGAGLLVRSFLHLTTRDPGFSQQHLLTERIMLPLGKYSKPAQQAAFFKELLERVEKFPGVKSAAATSSPPLTNYMNRTSIEVEGQPTAPVGSSPSTYQCTISPAYFHVFEIPLVSGRHITPYDAESAPRVALVNQALARRFFGDQNPLGQRIRLGGSQGNWYTIVGLARNAQHLPLEMESSAEVYTSYLQDPVPYMTLIIRTDSDPTVFASIVRSKVWEIDPLQPVYDVATMEQRLRDSTAPQRFDAVVLGLFATISLGLAAIGIYRVMSNLVTGRTHEIGIRMAIGARQQDILKLVLGYGFKLLLVGSVIGFVGGIAIGRFLESRLYGVSRTDLITLLGTSVLMMTVGLLACYIPARRATKVDPMVALRYE
jgi:putative ABC transport system permease protein